MAVAQPSVSTAQARVAAPRRRFPWGTVAVNGVLAIICLIWTIPTIGLLVSSFRTPADITGTGWWTIVPHPGWVAANQVQLQKGSDLTSPCK